MTQLQLNTTALEKLIYKDLHSKHGLFPDDIFLYNLKPFRHQEEFKNVSTKKKQPQQPNFINIRVQRCNNKGRAFFCTNISRVSLNGITARTRCLYRFLNVTVRQNCGCSFNLQPRAERSCFMLILQRALAKSFFSVFLSFLFL